MSLNQSRSEKSESQFRKSGRSSSFGSQQRSFSGKGGGSGGGTPHPPASSLSSSRSFNKKSNNAQGGHLRTNVSTLNSEPGNASAASRGVQNGAHVLPPLHGASDGPVAGVAAKPTESASSQKSNRAVPKAPSSQSATVSCDTTDPTTPSKAPGDASRSFPLQFGSISPGFMNGMQIPARTTSAPPNLDEQKRDQARPDSFVSAPTLPIPSVPKQQLPRKDAGPVDQSNTAEAHPMPKAKKDAHILSAPTPTQTQKPSVLPMTGISMQMSYHHPQVPLQFGGPNPQIQSQGMTPTSLQMPLPMPIPMGNAPQVQQQVFVSGLQPHPMQPQGIMHQGQNLGFAAQMGPQLPPQLSNLGMGINPPFPQQQAGKFGGPRKTTVKITHPETHEELRLDRSHPNMSSQSQPMPSFTPAHSLNYYANSYNASPLFFSAPSSLPLTSTQITPSSQVPRYNYPVSQGPQAVSFMNTPTLNSLSVNKTGTHIPGIAEPSNLEHARDIHNVISSSPSATVQVSVKPAAVSILSITSPGDKVADSTLSITSPAVVKVESPILFRPPGEASSFPPHRDSENYSESSLQQLRPGVDLSASTSVPVASKQPAGTSAAASVDSLTSNTLSSPSVGPSVEPTLVLTNAEGRRREALSRSNSMKDNQKKPGKKGHTQPQHQVGGLSTSMASLPSQVLDHRMSSNSGISESIEDKRTLAPSGTSGGVLESTSEELSTIGASESNIDNIGEGSTWEPSKVSGAGNAVDTVDTDHHAKQDDVKLPDELLKHGTVGTEEQRKTKLLGGSKADISSLEISSDSLSSKPQEVVKQTEEDSVLKVTSISNEVGSLETTERELEEPRSCPTQIEGMSSCTTSDSINAEILPLSLVSSTISHGDNGSTSDASSSMNKDTAGKEAVVTNSVMADEELVPVTTPHLLEATLKSEGEGAENIGSSLVSPKPASEANRAKTTMAKAKKKRKEILQKADAAGTTSDLYMAYKGPEEKKEIAICSKSTESTSSSTDSKQVPADSSQEDVLAGEKDAQSKAEPDDWEDAADISTPKLETSDHGEGSRSGSLHHDADENGVATKKYSRDFLLKFAEQCTDLPVGFETTSDIAEALIGANVNISHFVDRDSYPSPGRPIDRPAGGPRADRRGSGAPDEDKWSKLPGSFGPGRELRLDIGYGGNIVGFRPGQGGNYGVLRNPRAQTPVQYAGGILSGPMQSLGSQGGMQRNSPDADRWQRPGLHKGLIPSPQTPLQVMHKAEKKYEVGKITDEEQTKQRQLKAILNKLTPQNFEKLFQQVKVVNIDNAATLTGVISQIFDKALMEPTFCEMYANFCHHLAGELPDFCEDNEKITFKRLLLNKCQEEFERGEREQEEANRVEEGEIKQSEAEREEKRTQARRRMLGNIRLIGELYKKKMLTERIMHECIKKLLGQYQNPDEEDVEALCKLMSTIGEMIDHAKAKEHMDLYFDCMAKLSNNMKLSSRVRFMLKDSIDLRKNKWQQRRKVEGPKKIEEVHRDAAQERQAQASRLARGPGSNSSVRRGAPMDFCPRGSTMLASPNSHMAGFRGIPTQTRGYGNQDVRSEERQHFEGRTISVPLPQRPVSDDPITLGPQGGLARGMSIRGPVSMSTLADIPPGPGDSRRMTTGLNGFSSVSERPTYSSREDLMPRYIPERFVTPSAYEQSSGQERNMLYGNRDVINLDRNFDRPLATSPPTRIQGPSLTQNVPSEKVWSEEYLRDMSISAIKEFYSAEDEKEVALCIKDLNSPSFYPSMISLWVTDSFERKDMERDLLAKLLVNLTKSQEGMLTQVHLFKGFEFVLTSLEDTVNDAPRAAEFLGRIFAKVILENVIPLGDIGQLIYRGGEQPGRLLEIGLAADVLGSILEKIQSEKGDSILNEIRSSSKLRLEDFRPPDPIKSKKLDNFI